MRSRPRTVSCPARKTGYLKEVFCHSNVRASRSRWWGLACHRHIGFLPILNIVAEGRSTPTC
jgi:hypothetical protein